MKSCRKIISFLIAITLILSSLPFSLVTQAAAAADPKAADSSLAIRRPVASVHVTDVTRVAYAKNSMRQPSGSNSIIVKATPSGMPELNGNFSSVIAYAGETPMATQISFTPGVELPSAPTIVCSNNTVTLSNYSYSNGTYIWSVTGGTATVGTTLIFTITYNYTDHNAVTGKDYTRTYKSYGVSYVEAIVTPAGEYSTKRTYEDFFFGQSTKNRSYVASYILGANTYGTLYNNGVGEGSVFFESTNSSPGWTTEYGMMHTSDGHSADRDYNIAYHADDNRPFSYVYFDRSIHSTLSDLNLRIVTSNLDEASNEGERVTVSVRNTFVEYGVVNTYDGEDDDSTLSNNTYAANEIGLATYSGSIKGAAASFNMYFTGSGPSAATGTNDYTVTIKYQTAAGWNEVFIGHSHSLRIITVDKGALRTFVENIQGTEPTVMTTDLPSGSFKGYNPQEWYYSSGWEAFLNAYQSAMSCIKKPNASQTEIDTAYNTLKAAYDALEMRTADYSIASAYYGQAQTKIPGNYTLSSWAKVQNILDAYVANYSAIYQPAVDKTAADLKAALDSLEEAQADYTEFNAHLKTVNSLISRAMANYGKTPADTYNNWDKLVETLRKTGCIYDELDGYIVAEYLLISDQATVNGYVLQLERAINALTLKSANYVEATKAETAYKALNLSQVTADSAAEATIAYNALVALKGRDMSYQPQIDAATATLNEKLANLQYKPADISAALQMIATANSIDRSQYADMSAVDQAKANLESKLDLDIRYQNDINRATSQLQTAINSLNKNSADYSKVEAAIARVVERENLIIDTYADTYGFTAETFYSNWSNVIKAVNSVVYGIDFTQQSTVDAYATAINNALDSLVENTADYTAVRAVYDQAYTLVTTGSGLYTEASLDRLTLAYTSVVFNRPISQQAEVDAYVASINEAIEALDYLPADYTQVNKQLAIAQEKIKLNNDFEAAHDGHSYYTKETLANLETVVASVDTGLDLNDQKIVDGYVTALSEAISTLEIGPADYTQVELALQNVPDDLSLYTTLTVATLNATIKNINYTYTADKQATVDRYVTSINNAVGNLKFKAASYTAVNAAVQAAEAEIAKGVYTEDTVAALQAVVDSVEYNLTIDKQDVVDFYAEKINEAIGNLVIRNIALERLEEAIRIADEEIAKGIYTEDTVYALNSPLNTAKTEIGNASPNLANQDYVNMLATLITDLTASLVIKPADYTEVEIAITAANEKIATGWYTDDSVALLQAEIDKVVYGLDITEQERVILFANNIVNLTNELQLKLADYTELQKILDLLDNSDSEIYTNVYTNFNEVLSLIVSYREETVSQNMNLTADKQAQVDEMTATLQGYIDSLIPAQAERFEIVGGASVKTQGGVNYIVGLQPSLTKAKFQSTYADYENVTLEYNMTTARYMGTGSTVTVKSTATGEVIAEYVIVIYGDVDGTATINGRDAAAVSNSITGVADSLTGAAKLAANVEGTRATINAKDASVIRAVAGGSMTIDQSTGKGIEV